MDPLRLAELLGPDASACRRGLTGEVGVALPPFVDHHVHLHLIDDRTLSDGGIAGVLDLGGDPVHLARPPRRAVPRRAYAGAFLTAAGGYPTGRSWAPAGTIREVTDPSSHPGVAGGAATAVDEQASFGASVIKVSLNAEVGAVFDDETLAAVVTAARERGLPVVAHAQGEGMPRRALRAGVDALAHTPFTERLGPRLVASAVAAGQRWISTLDIHRGRVQERANAIANLAAFSAAGGRVLYGTDLGNGDLPVGVNPRELAAMAEAGVSWPAIIASLTDPWPLAPGSGAVATFVPGTPPESPGELAPWLARATVVLTEELVHDND
ncbi:hypothetical protein QL996_13040 [Planococcus sp. APC 4015]|nr:hypothetical protein [Planococcus sp. APC 4015]